MTQQQIDGARDRHVEPQPVILASIPSGKHQHAKVFDLPVPGVWTAWAPRHSPNVRHAHLAHLDWLITS